MKSGWIFWLLILAFIGVIATHLTDLEKLSRTLAEGHLQLVIAAGFIQVFYYLALSASYQYAFHTVEVESHIKDILPVTLGSIFINVVAPTAGTGGAALFIDDARRRGQSPARAAAGTLLQFIAYLTAFSAILIPGLTYLFIQKDLQIIEVIAAIILFTIVLSLSGVLILGLFRPDILHILLDWLQHTVNRFTNRYWKKNFLSDNWAETYASEFNVAATTIARKPMRLTQTLGMTLLAHLVNISTLYLLFLAFNQTIPIGPLIAGYAIGILFLIVSITPQGIGVVEGMMTVVYTSLGIVPSVAATVALAFRGITFWLPFLLGFISIRHSRRTIKNLG